MITVVHRHLLDILSLRCCFRGGTSDQPKVALVDLIICGRVLVSDGTDQPPAYAKSRGVLGVLLTRPRTTFQIDDLVDWVWGADQPYVGRAKIIQGPVSKARQLIKSLPTAPLIRWSHSGYRIDVDPDRVDLHRAKSLAKEGHRHAREQHYGQACTAFSAALGLLREEPLAELRTALADAFREQVRDHITLPAYSALAASQIRLGDAAAALNTLDDLMPEHRFDLALALLRFEAMRAMGDIRGADDYHQKMRRALLEQGFVDDAAELTTRLSSARSEAIPPSRPIPDAVPAAPSGPTPPRRLPRHHNRLIDRDRLLSELDDATDQGAAGRVIVLTGAAGIGKTELALHWAHLRRDRFSDGDVHVDMRGFSSDPQVDSGDLVRRLLAVFAPQVDRLADEEDQAAYLAQALQDKHPLLLLDNVREVDQVRRVLDLAPDALILITSRSQLSGLFLQGSIELPVGEVGQAGAAHWLYEVIGLRCSREPDAFDELVGLCGGIPLAFNLVGQHARTRQEVALSTIAESLRDEQRILGVGRAGGSESTTIEASFLTSYRALSAGARRLFRLLGLHPLPTFTIEIATALLASTRSVAFDYVDELLDLHLITSQATGYRMLDLVHQFAVRRVEREEPCTAREGARRRMFDHYLGTVAGLDRILFPYRSAVPAPAISDTCAPVTCSDTSAAFNWYKEHHRQLVAVAECAHRVGAAEHAYWLAHLVSEPLQRIHRHDEALQCMEWALAVARDDDPDDREISSLHGIGFLYLEMGRLREAEKFLEAVLEQCSLRGEPAKTIIALNNLGKARLKSGERDSAEEMFRSALVMGMQNGQEKSMAVSLLGIGRVLRENGRDDDASLSFYRSLHHHERVDNTRGIGIVLAELAKLFFERGDHHAAVGYATQARARSKAAFDSETTSKSCHILAAANQALGRHGTAIECARESLRACWRTGIGAHEVAPLVVLSSSLEAVGNATGAEEGRERLGDLTRSMLPGRPEADR